MKRLCVAIVCLFGLIACGDYPCSTAVLGVRLVGFTDTEVDTIVLRRFEKNNPLAKDSFVFNVNNPIQFVRFGDTLTAIVYPPTLLMQSDHDYEFSFPEAGRAYRITEITEEQSFTEKGLFNSRKEDCVNPITAATINGQQVTSIEFPNRIYLIK